MEFLLDLSVWNVLMVVIAAIVLDAVLGILVTFKPDEENFDVREFPRFIATSIFPFVGGLAAVALTADRVGQPFDSLFYVFAVPVLAKFIAEIKDKFSKLFEVKIT